MKRANLGLLIGAIIAVLGVLWAVKYVYQPIPPGPKPPTQFVPRTWADVRDGPGHIVHLEVGVQCLECHTEGETDYINPGIEACERCHGAQPVNVHTFALLVGKMDCFDCHNFYPQQSLGPDQCIRCHAAPQGPRPAIEIHAEQACVECHRPHEDVPLQPRNCADCHQVTATHKKGVPVDQTECQVCHAPHSAAKRVNSACIACHSTEKPAIPTATALFAGHDRCIDCHKPHDAKGAVIAQCAQCHENRQTAGADRATEHRRCVSCHQPHTPKSAFDNATCTACHAQVELTHAKDDASADRCASCHVAHGESPTKVQSCSSCHDFAGSDVGTHAAKLSCGECHVAHSFQIGKTAADCGRCHEQILAATKRLEGHAKCVDCHVKAPHDPGLGAKLCRECHSEILGKSPEAHTKCRECHATHDGARTAGAKCVRCHEDSVRSAHVRLAAKACADCHKSHDRRKPDCASCHPKDKLRNLHTVAEHQACADCHTVHGDDLSAERARCVKCHQQQRAHEPEAKTCRSCHPFG